MTNIMVKANLKIDAGRESNSHSKYVVLNKCACIIADVILKATHANETGKEGSRVVRTRDRSRIIAVLLSSLSILQT